MRMDTHRGDFPELAQARSLFPEIVAAQPRIEQEGQLPPELAARLKETGMFGLLLPASLGGSQLSLPEFARVTEVLGEADGSVGWCIGIGATFANFADCFDTELTDEIWGPDPGAAVATGQCLASSVDDDGDGYRLSGKWSFASGCMHADWLAALVLGPGESNLAGATYFLVPQREARIGHGWNVRGMSGTGSREYTLDGIFVPRHRAFPISAMTTHGGAATGLGSVLLFTVAFAAAGLGIARRSLDVLRRLMLDKTDMLTGGRMAEDDLVQTGIASAEADWSAARSFLMDVADECAHVWRSGSAPSYDLRAQLRLAGTHGMRQSGRIVDQVYELAGASAIFEGHPIQRCFQDVHALTQQVQGRRSHYRTVGRVLLGLETDTPMI